MKKRFHLLAVVLAAALVAAAGLVTTAAPASASSRACTANGAGCASFRSYGEHFEVCDYSADGHAVTVVYSYDFSSDPRARTATNSLGAHTCRDINRSIREQQQFSYQVCLADHGSPGGTPMRILWYTCGGQVTDWA